MHHPGRPTFGVQVFGYYEFRLFPNYPINQKKKVAINIGRTANMSLVVNTEE